MIYTILAMVFMIATGLMLSRYERHRTRRERRERLSQRARRCVRREY
ncbi:MAG: hypothetical protein OXU51_11580 [Candidatus Poribacteria bacterium]|nr:hypothetical protein [Candidatus Poribacteria bacterium]